MDQAKFETKARTGRPSRVDAKARAAKAAATRAQKQRRIEAFLRGEVSPAPAAVQDTSTPAPSAVPVVSRDEAFRQLLGRANAGDKVAIAELRHLLDNNPEIWRRAGDLAAHTERTWIELLAGGSWLAAESLRRQLVDLKAELLGSHPTAMEQLLADLIVTNWLATQHATLAASTAGGSLEQASFRLRRAESAEKRFLTAARTLATLRALIPHGLAPLDTLRPFRAECQRA